MAKRGPVVAAVASAVVVLVVVGVVLGRGGFGGDRDRSDDELLVPSKPVEAAIRVDLGDLTERVETIRVAGGEYRVARADGQRSARARVTEGAGGVAAALDGEGHLLGTAPVWALEGSPVSDVPVSCTSTAFDQLLLTPGLGRPDPLLVQVLWGVAGKQPTAGVLDQLGRSLCAGLARDPKHLNSPDDAEQQLYAAALNSLVTQLDGLAAQLPALTDSLQGEPLAARSDVAQGAVSTERRTAIPAVYRPGSSVSAATPAAEGGEGGSDCEPVTPANDQGPPLQLCRSKDEVKAVNQGAAWQLVFPEGQPVDLASMAGLVPGQTALVPSVAVVMAAIAHDAAAGAALLVCQHASFIPFCGRDEPLPKSAVLQLFDLVRDGEGAVRAADGYYSVAFGSGTGSTSSFPGGTAGTAGVGGAVRASQIASFITGAVLPIVGLIIDEQVDKTAFEDLDGAVVLPVLKELVAAFAEHAGKATEVPALSLKELAILVSEVLGNPPLLAEVLKAFWPFRTFAAITTEEVADRLRSEIARYVGLLAVPAGGWVAGLAEFIVTKGPSIGTAVLSIAGLLQAQGRPSYGSWPAPLGFDRASALPLSAPYSEGSVITCPTPPQGLPRVPGAPERLDCLWVAAADLDGNGTADRLVTWRSGQSRGAVAFLDSGSTQVLANADTDDGGLGPWGTTSSVVPRDVGTAGLVDGGAQPVEDFAVVDARRQLVMLATVVGGRGTSMALVGLGSSGDLRLVTDADGVFGPSDDRTAFGCTTDGGKRYFVESYAEHNVTPTEGLPAPQPYVFTNQSSWTVDGDDLRVSPAGWAGGTPSTGAAGVALHGCAADVPEVRAPVMAATTPETAVTGLLRAAAAQDSAAAQPYLSGYGDVLQSPDEAVDAWEFIKATGLDAASLAGERVSCSADEGRTVCQVPVGGPDSGLFADFFVDQVQGGRWAVANAASAS